MTPDHTPEEMMAVAAARRLGNGTTCFVGIGLPSKAANLARATHAPDCVLIYESGTIGAKPRNLRLSIGDGEVAEAADAVVSVPEIFSYWLQGAGSHRRDHRSARARAVARVARAYAHTCASGCRG